MTQRRCRYRIAKSAGPTGAARFDPYAADLVRRLCGLLAVVTRPTARCQDPVRRDDELLDRINYSSR
ncbi:MAG TPA: hypothetical protein VGL05_30265 [Kribbella sp.]